MYAKLYGSNNLLNLTRAFFKGLSKQVNYRVGNCFSYRMLWFVTILCVNMVGVGGGVKYLKIKIRNGSKIAGGRVTKT